MAWIEKTMEKILVKLILALTFAFVSSCVMAVTLPSTSYTSHYIDDNSYAASSSYDSQLVTMRFEALASAWGDACLTGNMAQSLKECTDCCLDKFYECCPYGTCDTDTYNECKSLQSGCANDCGRSIPIDGSEWVLILMAALAVVGKTVTMVRSKR